MLTSNAVQTIKIVESLKSVSGCSYADIVAILVVLQSDFKLHGTGRYAAGPLQKGKGLVATEARV